MWSKPTRKIKKGTRLVLVKMPNLSMINWRKWIKQTNNVPKPIKTRTKLKRMGKNKYSQAKITNNKLINTYKKDNTSKTAG